VFEGKFMALIVDAQVVKGFYQDTVLGKGHALTESASLIFDASFRKHAIYVDDEEKLRSEWRSGVAPEWFDIWYTDLLRDDVIREIRSPADKNLRKKLEALGFPFSGRDIWYARVSNATSCSIGFAILVSEDLDFYEPKEKGCSAKRRNEILLKELGSVRKYFKKERDIHVKPVARLIADYGLFCK
jgi:hypothetical protein